MMVQRMIGSQQLGTGGSSGYQYLRSTLRFLSNNIIFNMKLLHSTLVVVQLQCERGSTRDCKSTMQAYNMIVRDPNFTLNFFYFQ